MKTMSHKEYGAMACKSALVAQNIIYDVFMGGTDEFQKINLLKAYKELAKVTGLDNGFIVNYQDLIEK